MLSIITAVYNQLDMNKLFYEYLDKYTNNQYELIIIDNNSDDGSREYFQSLGSHVRVITNDQNYSYPYCQNQGVEVAKYDTLVFLNNDLLVSANWDVRVLEVLGKDGHHVVSLASNDRLYDRATTKMMKLRWKYVKYPIITVFGRAKGSLKLMHRLTYGHWERFTERNFRRYGLSMTCGFSGSAIIMNREALSMIGEWDSSQQGADFDAFFRTCHKSETSCGIKPIHTINGVFVHHYGRLTLYCKYPPFADAANLSTLDRKWPQEDLQRWSKRIEDFA